MSYSSSLSDAEWAILEPLLGEILPPKKATRPSAWSKRELIDAMLYQLKSGCNWQDIPHDFPPYSTVYWHYINPEVDRVNGLYPIPSLTGLLACLRQVQSTECG